jgi:hypothetical protein
MKDPFEDQSVRLCKCDGLTNHGDAEVQEAFAEDVAFILLFAFDWRWR